MLIPYWQLTSTDATRITWAIRHWIAHDPDTGAYLWSGRQRNRYGVTIPATNRADNIYLRFRANSDAEAYAKGQNRLANLLINSKLPAAQRTAPKETENEATTDVERSD